LCDTNPEKNASVYDFIGNFRVSGQNLHAIHISGQMLCNISLIEYI